MASQAQKAIIGTPAGLIRRMAAVCYDVFLLLAVLFFATLVILPFNHGNAIDPRNPLFTSYLFMVSFFFYGWFWTHGGQTLGLRAWKLRVQCLDGHPLGWWHALLRFLTAIASWAPCGLGFLWLLVDKKSMTWHDRFSETVIVQLEQ